jgi:hypothetical protein
MKEVLRMLHETAEFVHAYMKMKLETHPYPETTHRELADEFLITEKEALAALLYLQGKGQAIFIRTYWMPNDPEPC